MDRTQFLENLFIMFPLCFTPANVQIWRSKYETILSPRIDYDRLDYKFITTWKNMKTPPSPSELLEMAREYIPAGSQVLDDLDEARKNACPPPADFMDRVKKLQNKMSMGNVL